MSFYFFKLVSVIPRTLKVIQVLLYWLHQKCEAIAISVKIEKIIEIN